MGSQEPPCIYRVPNELRDVQPGAYRPRMLLIGPLHHSAKPKPREGNADADSRYLQYAMMEDCKLRYKTAFSERQNAVEILKEMKRIIEEEEENIRKSYAVSTVWILPAIFVELILNDTIFIMEFIIRMYDSYDGKIGDLIVDNPFYSNTIIDDLTLLENQLPYRYLKRVLDPIIPTFCDDYTLDQVIVYLFSVNGMINEVTEFNHFTDMFRCIYMESLGPTQLLQDSIVDMKNAEKLSSVGVEFKVPPEEQNISRKRKCSLKVLFEEGCLIMSSFPADESSNIILRNVIAYEQCHAPETAFATNYIHFMNFLVTTDKDVEILTSGGVLTNGVGRSSKLLETVNNLCIGVIIDKTQYHGIVQELNCHYNSRRKRTLAKLKKFYFSDLLTTTATLAAIFLLVLTLAGTVASIIQAVGAKSSRSPLVSATQPKP